MKKRGVILLIKLTFLSCFYDNQETQFGPLGL